MSSPTPSPSIASPAVWQNVQATLLAAHVRHTRQSRLYPELPAIPSPLSAQNLHAFLQTLPLTTKDQLAAAGPSAWAVQPHQVAEWVCTSGTLGKPLDIPLTPRDLTRLAQNEKAALTLAGIRLGDLVILAVGMERLFVAGLAYWLGTQALGATCVRAGPRIAERPAMLAELIARTAPAPGTRIFVIAVPSFLLNATPPAHLLTGIIAIGEPIKADSTYNTLGKQLHDRFNCPIMSTYAMTETCTTFAEGPQCHGGHINPELAILELLNDEQQPAAPGEVGEIVITPLGVEGLPLLRFRTGDMAQLFTDPCPCGRTTPRLGPILGRRQQLLKIKGVSLYPAAIIDALRSLPSIEDFAILAEQENALSDRLTICIQTIETATDPRAIDSHLRALLRIAPQIKSVSAEDLRKLQNSAGTKVSRFIDRRS